MKILKLNELCGIKNQLYSQQQYIVSEKEKGVINNFFDINSLFWSQIFNPSAVYNLVERAKNELNNDNSPKIKAILKQPQIFLKTVFIALKKLEGYVNEKELFQSLESLEILCHLHTKLYSRPHTLTLSQGYILSKFSALDMERNCLLPFYNPYLDFINKKVMPVILSYEPSILIMTGRPNLASFTIAKLVRYKIPNIFIIAGEHESDYYSLFKIHSLLEKNTAFFSVYNCAIISNYHNAISKIKKWYLNQSNNDLNNIPGIIYSLDNGSTIIKTNIQSTSLTNNSAPLHYTDRSYVYNIKVFSQNHCYWNKCSFCGINKKYNDLENQEWNYTEASLKLESLYKRGINRIWLLDEAIPPVVLFKLATCIIDMDIRILWHVRTRIEHQFINKVYAKTLFKAGLKHILFGFESASNRILQLMRKNFENNNYLEIAEKIVENFTSIGIQVHFTAILGFPTETKEERDETIDFLHYLHRTYSLFSYNLNIFYLDIGSEIYHRWEEFDISTLSFPCSPKYYLENHLDWLNSVSSKQTDIIYNEREISMKQQFEWYPEDSLIKPSIFFSFWEYSRYTLYSNDLKHNNLSFYSKQPIILSSDVALCKMEHDTWMLYHLSNHHYVVGGNILLDLVNSSKNKECFCTFIEKYDQPYKEKAKNLLIQLVQKEFFL
ncbi:MAG: radical SAM protein [Lachnospiraceae bacterium]|nr:radical SAM protein [Lachnospiraceae bacterium]